LFATNLSGNSAIGPRLDTGGWLTLTETITGFFPTGTFTPQDTPSFARRDNVRYQLKQADLPTKLIRSDKFELPMRVIWKTALLVFSFQVEAPVTRRSPHRPVREDFPHTVPWSP